MKSDLMSFFQQIRPVCAILLAAALAGGCASEAFSPSSERPLDLSLSQGENAAAAETHSECQIVPGRSIRVTDPTLVASYASESLGIVQISASDADRRRCLDLAIQDGARVLSENGETITVLYPVRFEAFLDAARERINIDAVEGRWNPSLARVIPGVNGRALNVEKTTQAFFDAVARNADEFALVIDDVPALSSDLASFADFKPTELIGEYRTVFSNKKNRTINVKLAASFCDGVFLMPGASFSYNEWVGERSEERGFKEAPVIEQGVTVEGLGGGACQVSSTIHAAALLAGLGVPERHNHSLPSSYIPMGLDAVVSYPILDLRIQNTFDRPIVIRVHTEENTLIAQIFSDKNTTHRVMVRTEVAEQIPFKETITVDPALEPGTIRIKKRGKAGYKVQRGRIFIEDGKERFEKLLADTYQSQAQQTFIAPDVIYPPVDEGE